MAINVDSFGILAEDGGNQMDKIMSFLSFQWNNLQ